MQEFFSRVGALSMRLRLFSGFSMLMPLFTKSLGETQESKHNGHTAKQWSAGKRETDKSET